MNRKKNIFLGIVLVVISVWLYAAMSTFEVLPGSSPKSLIVRNGVERTPGEVADALSEEMGFDLEGAYKSGYAPEDVVEYLISQPHTRRVSFHRGKYYEGRMTILHIIPLMVCIVFFIMGTAILIFKGKG